MKKEKKQQADDFLNLDELNIEPLSDEILTSAVGGATCSCGGCTCSTNTCTVFGGEDLMADSD